MLWLVFYSCILAGSAMALGFAALSPALAKVVESVLWVSLALCANQLLNLLLWQGLVARVSGNRAPRVLGQLSGALLMLTALSTVFVRVFELPVASVLTTSSVFIAIVGFALRNMISDLFTGIALGIEQPFSIGDWIQIQDGTVGRVVEMNWRSTRLLTREEISVVIPNSELAISMFKNYSKPERLWRDEFNILLDQRVTAHQAERILLSAVNQVPEIVQLNKQPEIRIEDYTKNGVVWQVRYWVPDYPKMSSLRYEVQKSVLRNMHYAGLSIPAEQVRLETGDEVVQDGTFVFLRAIEIFRDLSDEELRQLQFAMKEKLIKADQEVVAQGQAGESMFIVREGLLEVNIRLKDETNLSVAHLVPGSFFGEMSLLTGAPRNATVSAQVDSVAYEIDKKSLEPILHARPEIALRLSQLIEERLQRNRSQSDAANAGEVESELSLLDKISTFFALRNTAALSNELDKARSDSTV